MATSSPENCSSFAQKIMAEDILLLPFIEEYADDQEEGKENAIVVPLCLYMEGLAVIIRFSDYSAVIVNCDTVNIRSHVSAVSLENDIGARLYQLSAIEDTTQSPDEKYTCELIAKIIKKAFPNAVLVEVMTIDFLKQILNQCDKSDSAILMKGG